MACQAIASLIMHWDMPTVAGHARLAGNTGGDENDLSAGQALLEILGRRVVSLDNAAGVDVSDIGGDTYKSNQHPALASRMIEY